MIREAIDSHAPFNNCSLKVYVKGSYANNTNVRSDSDVDTAVECKEALYWEEAEPGIHTPSNPYEGGVDFAAGHHFGGARTRERQRLWEQQRVLALPDREAQAEPQTLPRALGSLSRHQSRCRGQPLAASREIETSLSDALATAKETGQRCHEPFIHEERAELARLQGDAATRERELREAVRLFKEMEATPNVTRLEKLLVKGDNQT